jgi:hypothetical protein
MKKVLIISPNFPPINAADMHRVRQILPFLNSLNWEAEVICVDSNYLEVYSKDLLLLKTIPEKTKTHYVKALDVKVTRKFGLGSLSIRSFYYYLIKGNELLKREKFDLVFFSTTSFHLLALGVYWKKRFKIPFVCDIQDPWRNDYYLSKPQREKPPKFWFNYLLDKFLEGITIPQAAAIISVSSQYCKDFRIRYPSMMGNCYVIPFGGVEKDFDVLNTTSGLGNSIHLKPNELNIIYIGRGGHDLKYAIQIFFKAIKKGIDEGLDEFKRIHCWFVGTSYSLPGQGVKTIEPIAITEGVSEVVTEITDRLPYFETLALLKKADILFVPGSMDKGYTASKIYPYILAKKPLIAIFHKESSVVDVLNDAKTGKLTTFELLPNEESNMIHSTYLNLLDLIHHPQQNSQFDQFGFSQYTAEHMTKKIIEIFESLL